MKKNPNNSTHTCIIQVCVVIFAIMNCYTFRRCLLKLRYDVDENYGSTKEYEKLWNALQEQGQEFYYSIRDKFNQTKNPAYFLFLS